MEWRAGGVVSPPSLASEAGTKRLLQAQAEVAVLPGVRAESGSRRKNTAKPAAEACRSPFPSPSAQPFPPGQPVPLEKQSPLPGDLGPAGPPSGLSSFRSHFSPLWEVGEGVTLEEERVRLKSSSVPLSSQAKKNSSLPRSFISVIYSRRCFLQYKQEAKNVGEERRAGGGQEEKEE